MNHPPDPFQVQFAARWGHLRHPHVRALAWLLGAPDLLDAQAPPWQGKITTLGPMLDATAAWLEGLEREPAVLDAALGARVFTRLGLYAEALMAFYFRAQGSLVAHGLQVRAARNDTVGEFDFLLDAANGALEHIEFATKFYLHAGAGGATGIDALVGPNLADTLSAKMRKILEQQLALGKHPAAQALLARPVARAGALVKGWLFYRAGQDGALAGIAPAHCRGFWCTLDEFAAEQGEYWLQVPRLAWLAPYGAAPQDADAVLARAALQRQLAERFASAPLPVLVAQVRQDARGVCEERRGFVVPPDWPARACAYRSP